MDTTVKTVAYSDVCWNTGSQSIHRSHVALQSCSPVSWTMKGLRGSSKHLVRPPPTRRTLSSEATIQMNTHTRTLAFASPYAASPSSGAPSRYRYSSLSGDTRLVVSHRRERDITAAAE